ncbi:MAG: tetratricopeptide repeat protein [Verrucomicrobiota bacterium]
MKTSILIVMVACTGSGWGQSARSAQPVGQHVVAPSARGYSVEAIREAGERGGMLLALGTNFTAAHNRAMGEAMELWNRHQWDDAVAAFRRLWQNHPESPWAAEAELHEACYLKYRGQFDAAEERFLSLLQRHPGAVELRRKVLHYLPDIYARTGRLEAARDVLRHLAETADNWQERQFLENYTRVYQQALLAEDANRRCGTKALALTLASQNAAGDSLRNVPLAKVYARYEWAKRPAEHPDGYSARELARLGGGQVLEVTLAELRRQARPGHPLLVYLKPPPAPRAFAVLSRPKSAKEPKRTGHFVVVERVSDNLVELLDPDDGRMRWTLGQFLYRWSGLVLSVPGQRVAGRTLSDAAAGALRGGCCGAPPPDPHPPNGPGNFGCGGAGGSGGSFGGNFGGMFGGSGPGPGCPACGGGGGRRWLNVGVGAPAYQIDPSYANLVLFDSPIWYPPAVGPALEVQLAYNRVATARMATYSNVNYYAFGPKWQFNFASYLTETPESNVWINLPGGFVQIFTPTNNTYEPFDVWNQNRLYRTNNYFVLEFHGNQERWYFQTGTDLGQRLERIEDRYGQAVTLQYGGGAAWRLTNLVDAVGRSLALAYSEAGLVTNNTVAGPFRPVRVRCPIHPDQSYGHGRAHHHHCL